MPEERAPSVGRLEPLTMMGPHRPGRDYQIGQCLTVDGFPAVIRNIDFDTSTVVGMTIEVFDTLHQREEALRARPVPLDG